MATQLLILGEHDKGYGEPFSLRTVSGRRLRQLLWSSCVVADLGNVFDYAGGKCVARDLPAVCRAYETIVALGRVAAAECKRQEVPHLYLPHPAVRSAAQLKLLEEGLRKLRQPSATISLLTS